MPLLIKKLKMLSTKIELSKRNFPNKDVTDYLETSNIKDFTYDLSIKDFADYLRVIPYKVTNCFKIAKKGESKLIESIKKSKNVFALNFASDFHSHLCYSQTKKRDIAFCSYYTNEDYEKYCNYINDITTNSGIYYFICTNMINSEHTNLLVVEKKEDGKKIFYSLDVNPLNNILVTYNLHKESEYVLLPDNLKPKEYDKISNSFIDILEEHKEDFRKSILEEINKEVSKKIEENKKSIIEKSKKSIIKEIKDRYKITNPSLVEAMAEAYLKKTIDKANISDLNKVKEIRDRYFKETINKINQFISEQQEDISEKSFAEFLIGKGHQVRANGFFVTINENSDKNCVDRVIELIDTLLKEKNKENVIKLLEEATFKLNENELDKFKKAAILSNYEKFKKLLDDTKKNEESSAYAEFEKTFGDPCKKIKEFLQKYKFNENEEFVNDILNKKYSELFKEEILKSEKSELIQKITDEENKQYLKNLESKHNNESKEKENSIYESASKPVLLSEDSKQKKVNEDKEITDNNQIGSHQKAELKRREEKNSQLQQGNQLQQGEN